jgi:hypothetical protein
MALDRERKDIIKNFVSKWTGKGYEKGESQKFWLELLSEVLGVTNPYDFIEFEDNVHIDKANAFMDGYIPTTKILIEQKSLGKDLRKAIVQSDGSLLNPFQQAKRYRAELPYDKQPRWIITSNFESFLVYDMNNPNGEPEEILLKDLVKEYYRLSFIVDTKSEHIKKEEELSFKAGELVGKIYDAFSKQYEDISKEESYKSLNELCVRLVFCLYAEDAELFGRKNAFHDYLSKYENLDDMREALIKLFRVLDTKMDDPNRKYMSDNLQQFPYVNGGLFSNENIEIPRFTEEIRSLILSKASDDFDWSEISPTIFGAVFESTLNPETRRSGGMHYTSIENIHKVIDPLFLDDLREELNDIEAIKQENKRNKELYDFQNKLASLTFLDPACGSGNFLTETYLSLRRFENEILQTINKGQMLLDTSDIIKVGINQFYGIEINDFACTVAKTALWIAESQMVKKTEEIVKLNIEFLPLKNITNIVEGNALKIDWNDVISSNKLNYIMGNPPFVGARLMNDEQKADIFEIFKGWNNIGNLDYVTGWYKKAADYIKNTNIYAAFVSTNSICQGEQVPLLWKPLFDEKIKINYAYRTFRWDSEASSKAHVHCIIVGFSYIDKDVKKIYENDKMKIVKNINAYLLDAANIFIESRNKPINKDLSPIGIGDQSIDDGNYLFSYDEMQDFIKDEPQSKEYFKEYLGAYEFLNNKKRYCLWLGNCPPDKLRNMPKCLDRVEKVKKFREASKRIPTLKLANIPNHFGTETIPENNYLIIPRVSSQTRRYIPIGFMSPDVWCADSVHMVLNATIYDLGILESNVHMSWVRAFAGRLKSDYRYSKDVVYNNFPWPHPTKEQKEKIEKTAQMILDARAKYPNSSLADLYDELTMPKELRTAHQLNDKAVMEAYNFGIRTTESECVSKLMEMYQDLIN